VTGTPPAAGPRSAAVGAGRDSEPGRAGPSLDGTARLVGSATAIQAAELGAAAEALAARGRLARVALEVGDAGAPPLAAVLGARPRAVSVARVALGTPGSTASIEGYLAQPLRWLAELVSSRAWRLYHVLPRAVSSSLRELASAAERPFPVASSCIERAGLAVLGAWHTMPRDGLFHAASLGIHAERARLGLAMARAIAGGGRAWWRAAALGAQGCADPPRGLGRSPTDAIACLVTDAFCPFSVAACLARIQEAAARFRATLPWEITSAWRELASLELPDPTLSSLDGLGEAVVSAAESVFGRLDRPLLSMQRGDLGSPPVVVQ
jgi:hypothetical protein